MRRFWWGFVAGLLLAATAALGAGALIARRSGLSARPEPSPAEERIARLARSLAVDSATRSMRNPVPDTIEALAEGRAHFADHCAICHANDGSGDTALGRRLYPRAPDMRLPATQELSDGELFHVIENGIRLTGMPGWGGEVPPEASWKLVLFVRHLPRISHDEVVDMERMNPKSPAEWKELQEDEEYLGGQPGQASPHQHH